MALSAVENKGIFPPVLHRGDTIALVSPSSRLNTLFPLRVSRAISALENSGFRVKTIFDPIPLDASFHNSILHRVLELHSAFADPDVKAIITTIGGLSANELLPYIDWELIKRNPKIFCGYSDITLLHLSIAKMTGLRTFYGPAAITQFGEYPAPISFTLDHFLHVISPSLSAVGKAVGVMPRSQSWTDEFGDWFAETHTLKARQLTPNSGWKWLRAGSCTGRITGGCLPSLLHLAGTKYWPDMSGKILLLETCEGEQPDKPLPLEQIRSLLADLVNLDVFDQIAGLILGRPTGHVGKDLEEFEGFVGGLCVGDFPILMGVDVGHTDPLLTVPFNALSRLDSEEDIWEVLEPGVMG